MIDGNKITIQLDKMVKAGLLKRIKINNKDEFQYKNTALNISIIDKIGDGLELNAEEKKALDVCEISEKQIRGCLS